MNSDHFTPRINGTILRLYAHLYPERRKVKLTCMINAKEEVIAGQYFKFIAEVGNTRINLNALYHEHLPKEVENYMFLNPTSAPPDRIIPALPNEVSILICKKVISDWSHLTCNIEKVLTVKEAETEAKKTEVRMWQQKLRLTSKCWLDATVIPPFPPTTIIIDIEDQLIALFRAIIKYEKSFCKCYLSNGPNKNHLTFLNISELDLRHCLDYNVLQIQILAKAAIPFITSLTSVKYTISYQRKEMPWYQSNFLQLLARLPCLHTFHLDTPMLAFTPPVELTGIDSGQQYFDVMSQHEETTITTWFRELPTLRKLYICHGELNEYEMFWYWEMDDSDKWHIYGRRLETDGELTIKEGFQSIENGQRNTSTSMWTKPRDMEAKKPKPKSISHERYRKIMLQDTLIKLLGGE
ncbi:hypothetical protein BKA93DRAFT_750403 [Sparassis latifolia]